MTGGVGLLASTTGYGLASLRLAGFGLESPVRDF